MRNNWLPYEAREPVETASFWAMVDRENRRHEGGSQVQDISIHREPCIEVEAEAEEVNDGNDEPLERHDALTTSPTSERSVEEDDVELVLASLDVVDSVETKVMEYSLHAGVTLTEIAVATIKKMETNSAEGPVSVHQGCSTIISRSKSIAVISLLFFTFVLYPRIGGSSILVDLACFVSLVLFYFYHVVWRN